MIQPLSREAENPRNLFCMDDVGRLIPMNPHAPQVITKEIVERVARQETEAVRNPVRLASIIVEVGLRPLAQFTDSSSPLVVGPRPDFKSNTIEGLRGVLLKDIGVVDAVRLCPAGADFDIVWEASLKNGQRR